MGPSGVLAREEHAGARVNTDRPWNVGWPLLLLAGWLLQVGVRLILAVHRTGPVLTPDELGYLLGAKLLAGEVPGAQLLAGAAPGDPSRVFYKAGYPLAISPAFWLSHDAVTAYRIVLLINSLVGASVLLLAFAALRQLGVARKQSYLIAHVTALLPTLIYYGQMAMSDAILPAVVFSWLLSVYVWVATGRSRFGVLAGTLAAYCWCVHSRGVIIVAAHASLLALLLWKRREYRIKVGAAANALTVTVISSWAVNSWVKKQIYPDGAYELGHLLVSRLTSLDGLGWTLALAAGKVWYLIVCTWGVAGVGLVAVSIAAVHRDTSRATRLTSILIFATMLGMAVASSAATPDEGTVGNLAYGRYLCCLIPVLFIAGAAFAVLSFRWAAVRVLPATVGLTLTLAAVVRLHAGDRLTKNSFGVFDFPEISFMTWSWGGMRLWVATGAALSLLALTSVLIARFHEVGPYTAMALFIGLSLSTSMAATIRITNYYGKKLESDTSLAWAGASDRDHVAVDYRGLDWRIRTSMAIQTRNGLIPFDRDRPNALPAGTTLAVIPSDGILSPELSWLWAPDHWKPVASRSTSMGDWVAWRRVG